MINADELRKTLAYLVDCVGFFERVSEQPCCNTCGKMRTCEYRPGWGKPTRINCPLWEEESRHD